jgi:AAA15 family ATPase/GTPase
MIQSLEISNFRGFKHIALSNLPRFNVLIGESGSGKTAFLESLWIQCGISPEIYFRMRFFRGMAEQQFQLGGDKLSYEAFFNDIFYDHSLESGALIQIMDSDLGSRYLNIAYGGSAQTTMDMVKVQPGANPTLRPIHFRWKVGDAEYDCPLKVVSNQIVVENPPPPYPGIYFASSFVASARETSERLSILSIQGEKDKIVQTIKRIYPDIVDISSESISGQQLIWVSIRGLKRKIPLALVSSGINKFVSLLLGVCLNPGGVLLIDEIDNGFYFRDYQMLFSTLVEFCDAYRVQLFAATHSLEFLKAVAKVMHSRVHDLSMLKTKFRDGECTIKQLEGVSSVEALNQDIEIRL